MKTFVIRTFAIVMAVILFAGAIYTCGIVAYMCILSNGVAEAELMASSGDSHMRRAADAVYESVLKSREELYYGGGYKSWFSTLPKTFQIIGVLVSIAIIAFELLLVYALWCNYKDEQEIKKRKAEMKRYEMQRRAREAYWNGTM